MTLLEHFDPETRRVLSVWNATGPPLRPSSDDIEWFARVWKGGRESRALIMGATPELVDLAVRKNVSRVIAMDYQEAYFTAMQQLASEDWKLVEHILNDWRNPLPDLEGNLDVVLGDGSLTMVPFPSEWERVLNTLYGYLVPGGQLILRLAFQPEKPFDLELYMKQVLSRFDADSIGAGSERKFALLRDAISELRLAFGVASAGLAGLVNPHRRAELVHKFHVEFTARCSDWKEWDAARVAMPTETETLKESNRAAGKAFPPWQSAIDIAEACGFKLIGEKWSGTRPTPGVMRFMVAERR